MGSPLRDRDLSSLPDREEELRPALGDSRFVVRDGMGIQFGSALTAGSVFDYAVAGNEKVGIRWTILHPAFLIGGNELTPADAFVALGWNFENMARFRRGGVLKVWRSRRR